MGSMAISGRRRLGSALMALLTGAVLLTTADAARAAGGSDGLRLYGVNTVRLEHWRFFDPASPGGAPDYDFLANRLRVGLRYERPRFALHVAGQYVQLLSLPDDAAGAPGGALGTGALYFGHSGRRAPNAVQLKYLNLELRNLLDTDLDLTLGRFSYASGLEAVSGVPKIEKVKKSRVSDRLIGEFGWSQFQRSFDGAKIRWKRGSDTLSLAAFRPTEGGFEDGGTRRIDDIDVVAASYTLAPGRLLAGAEVQGFYTFYSDERRVTARVDNSGSKLPSRQDIHLHTFGGHLVGAWALGSGELDLMAWGALQTGRWFRQDHAAGAAALEVGYQLTAHPWKPWIRLGAFRSTGDSDPGDGDHETFFQMLPTARRYAMTAAYNLMNSTDTFVELRLSPTPRLSMRAEVHDLRLSQRADRWYAGAGATQNQGRIFGFGGRPSGGHRHLGTVAQLTIRYRLADFATLHAFYGRLWGGNVVENSFSEDEDLDFFFLELTFRGSTS